MRQNATATPAARAVERAGADGLPRRRAILLRAAGVAVLLVVLSAVTVLRYSAQRLNADGLQQSVMSIHGVELFYWGQDRLVPVVSLLASPISDPTINLWVCLLLQGSAFYGLLLLAASRMAAAVLERTDLAATLVLFLLLVAMANAVFTGDVVYVLALEGQPYALSWLLTLASYLLWRRDRGAPRALAAVLALVAGGVNPTSVLLAGLLALGDLVRTRRWGRWVPFGVLWLVVFGIWVVLADQFGGTSSPGGAQPEGYFDLVPDALGTGLTAVFTNVLAVTHPVRVLIVIALAVLAYALLPATTRKRLAARGALFAVWTAAYVVVFAANPWVGQNGYHVRYFFPLLALVVVGLAVPIGVLLSWVTGAGRPVAEDDPEQPPFHLGRRSTVAVTATAAAAALSLAGPFQLPQRSVMANDVSASVAYAEANDVRFLSGFYWNMWPAMHQLLDGGRDAVYVAAEKSGGDRADYERALDEELAADGEATALCLNERVSTCIAYLDGWTRPGWVADADRPECPAPHYTPAAQPPRCEVLTYRASP